MNPRGLRDLDPLGNHKHPCASREGVYIGFCRALNLVDPSDSSYNLYIYIKVKVNEYTKSYFWTYFSPGGYAACTGKLSPMVVVAAYEEMVAMIESLQCCNNSIPQLPKTFRIWLTIPH